MLTLHVSSFYRRWGIVPYSAGWLAGGKRYSFSPLIALPSGKRPYTISFKPSASKKNFVGNRNVDHYNVDGQLFGKGFQRVPLGPSYDYMLWQIGSLRFTHIVTGQLNYEETFPIDSFEPEAPTSSVFAGEYNVAGMHFVYSFVLRKRWKRGEKWTQTQSVNVWAYRWKDDIILTQSIAVPTVRWDDWDDHVAEAREKLFAYARAHFNPSSRHASQANPEFRPQAGLRSSTLHNLKWGVWHWFQKNLSWDRDYVLLGEATQKACSSAKYFSGNTGMYIAELVQLRNSLADLKKLLSGNVTLKSLSSLYLQGKYGLTLTLQDTRELGTSLARYFARDRSPKLFSVVRGRATNVAGDIAGCKIYYDPKSANGFAKVVKGLFDWDLFFTFKNVWDIVPYSFVVDWFAGVESFLSAFDTHTYLSVLNAYSFLYTYKSEVRTAFPGASYGFRGMITARHFARWSTDKAIEPTPTFSGGQPLDHIPEGAALIIQSSRNAR